MTDPDETEGRLLYRQRADAEARKQMAMTRHVRLTVARERSDTGRRRRQSDPPRDEPTPSHHLEADNSND